MAALSAERMTDQIGNAAIVPVQGIPVKGNVKIYKGAQVCLNAGYLAPFTAATGLVACGRAKNTYDNTGGADGAINGEAEMGQFGWDIGTSGDALTQANVGALVYGIDDHTVGATDGSGTRSVAGRLWKLENGKAFVQPLP